MQVTQLAHRAWGAPAQAAARDKEPLVLDDLFKPTPPNEPERPKEPGDQGWGYTAAFTLAGLAAGAVSGFSTGAHMGGIWGGIVGGVLNLIPSAAIAVAAAVPLSESDAPGLFTVGIPLGLAAGGIGLGAYWGATGHLGGPIGLAVTGGITGALLIGIWGYFRSESKHEKKLDAYYRDMSSYDAAMKRFETEKKEYDKELKAWSSRHEEKTTSTRILEGARKLILNGIQLKKRERPGEKPEADSGPGC